jgi:hypothetical protein
MKIEKEKLKIKFFFKFILFFIISSNLCERTKQDINKNDVSVKIKNKIVLL